MLNSGITILVYVLSESFVEVHEHDTFCIKWKGPGKKSQPQMGLSFFPKFPFDTTTYHVVLCTAG